MTTVTIHLWEIGDGYLENLLGTVDNPVKWYVEKQEKAARKKGAKACFWIPPIGEEIGVFGSGERLECLSDVLSKTVGQKTLKFDIHCGEATWVKIVNMWEVEKFGYNKIH